MMPVCFRLTAIRVIGNVLWLVKCLYNMFYFSLFVHVIIVFSGHFLLHVLCVLIKKTPTLILYHISVNCN